jgi:hypothetical protein
MTEARSVLREPPEDLLTYKPDSIIALLDDEDEVRKAIEELTAAGFPGNEIYVLGGKEGAEKLDPTGEAHGIRGRLLRLMERFGEETRLLEQQAAHLEKGGFGILVPATDDQVGKAWEVLREHGAHDAYHLGKGHWEPIGSVDE